MILVTGGTGLVGSHLLVHLLQKQEIVRATYRTKSSLKAVKKVFEYYTANATTLFNKIDWVQTNLNDIATLDAAFKSVTHVYHAAAYISFDPWVFSKLKKINVDGTANIVNLCLAHKVKKLCYVSTIGTIGKSSNGAMADEKTEWNDADVNVYALTKYNAEMEVWRGSQEGLQVVMVNPGVIVGPGFWHNGSGLLFTTANKGHAFYPPGGTGFVAVNDVVKIMTSLMKSTLVGERFIVVAKNKTFKEVLTTITTHLGKKAPKTELKKWQLQLGMVYYFILGALTGKERRITKNTITSLYKRGKYNNNKLIEALNFEYEPIEETLKFCCDKFIEETT